MNLPSWLRILVVCLTAGCAATRPPIPSPGEAAANARTQDWPGTQSDGRFRLPNQWFLDPVGKQVPLGDSPVAIAVHPSGRHAAILHSGFGPHEIVVVDLRRQSVASRIGLEECFYGLAFSPDGTRLFASGAGQETVLAWNFSGGLLSSPLEFRLRPENERGVPSGISISPDGRRLFVANLFGQSVSEVDLTDPAATPREIILGPTAAIRPVDDQDPWRDLDNEAITKRARALLEVLNSDAPYPYACVHDAARNRLYVSFWGMASIGVIDLAQRKPIARWTTDDHPNEMLLNKAGTLLFVANANRNTVTLIDTESGRIVESLASELEPQSPPGSTPNSLALSPDESLLFVANANINAVAVFDVGRPGHSRSLGFIPVGWYPTSVRLTPDGRQLLVANGKGVASRSNRHGPQPGRKPASSVEEYIGGLFQGTLSILQIPDREKLIEQLASHTQRALRCRPPKPAALPVAGHPVPLRPDATSPIRYCIYLIKENRTYDQVLGDLPMGNGDPALCLFPESVTPNHHQLARDFVLLDNFYVESEVSADGHEWTMGAYATDYVERLWPLSYGHNQRRKYAYPSEGRFKIAEPAGGYLWDRAREAGVTYRSYGEFVNNGASTNEPCSTLVKNLQDHFDPWFRSFDMDYSDLARADRFISELHRFEAEGDMPRLQIVRLPNDHTAGSSVGKPTPTAYVAENDLAFGRVIEALSHSRFWPQTAVFVVEDDAQDGPDHVDAHRTIAYVISPYTRSGTVDSTLYSTASMLRTIELILGLRPMSQFDAAAMPMINSFRPTPNLRPYVAKPVPDGLLQQTNPVGAWGADLSAGMNFAKEDAADDHLLNDIVWRSVRGADSPMPAPRRAGFVLPADEEDEDEDARD